MVGRRSGSMAAIHSKSSLSRCCRTRADGRELHAVKVAQAEADRLQARLAEREKRREAKSPTSKSRQPPDDTITPKALSERFLNQTHEQNARDPDLRRAQSLVAQTISITRAKYPDDPLKASKEVEGKRQEIARRIASGDAIAAVQVRSQQAQRVAR